MAGKGRSRDQRSGGGTRMEDVAAAAGVSLATVSRVFSQPDQVSPATREKVQAVAAEMRYLPNILASSMAANQSRLISALVPAISNAIFAQTIEGLSSRLTGSGYELMLSQSHYDPAQELSILRAFLGRRADGIAIAGAVTEPASRALLAGSGTPVVEMWELVDDPLDMAVGFSNQDAARAAGAWLAGRGYSRMGFVGGTDQRTQARLAGFRQALQAAGLPPPLIRLIPSPAPSSFEAGGMAMAWLMTEPQPPQAVFCTNDLLAVGALFECQRRGLDVPGQVAVMGFSDLDIGRVSVPPLTTVQVSAFQIGQRAADLLLERLGAGPQAEAPQVIDTGFSILKRGSA